MPQFSLYDFENIAGKVAAPKFRVESTVYARSQSFVANYPPMKGGDVTIAKSLRPSRQTPL